MSVRAATQLLAAGAPVRTVSCNTKPYEGPEAFVIDDLSDDEWDRFVAALDE